ncbi:MAG: hypothetical protein HYZ26_01965 [Chloroflexi bacterium]|nr:hypothetical protein [Chloroflexota bacterium]
MPAHPLSRQALLDALLTALAPLPYVHAAWQGGAAAFGRADEYSDIDLHVIAGDERVEDVFEAAEAALTGLSPIRHKYRLPEPAWHGMSQTFYILEAAGPYRMVDLVVGKFNSAGPRFWEPEVHGHAIVHINKDNTFKPQLLDAAAHLETLKGKVEGLRASFLIFQPLVEKEILRRQPMDALHFYLGRTLRPLIQLLRTLYAPWHYDWGGRYLYRELPPEHAARLETLSFVCDVDDLHTKHEESVAWFNELAESLDWGEVAARLEKK